MNCSFYKTVDSRNTLDKTLTDKTDSAIVFLTEQDIMSPAVKLSRSGFDLSLNYASIEIDGKTKYYFIDSVKVLTNDIFLVNLTVDVLMTYQDEIKGISATVIESDATFNDYKRDYAGESVRETLTYEFENPLQGKSDVLITTVGGSV